MTAITFENELGRIEMHGGKWRVIEATGLGLPAKNVNAASFPNEAGQKTLSMTHAARLITISGDISETDTAELSRAVRILDRAGALTAQSGAVKRKIPCYCSDFEPQTRRGAYQKYVAQFTCDNPYFADIDATEIEIFGNSPMISDTFTLPCIWSERVFKTNAANSGDVTAEPVITVSGTGAAAGDLTIKNNTTGSAITLKALPALDGSVIIDISNRSVVSGAGASLISYLSDDSFLGDFTLAVGENEIEVLYSGSNMTAICEFSNKYLEAVI